MQKLLLLLISGLFMTVSGQIPEGYSLSTRSAVERLMRENPPRLTFDSTACFPQWQAEMRQAMTRLMRHPDKAAEEPRMLWSEPREGYTLQKWVSFPLDSTAVPFLVLVPDGLTEPTAAVLCIPGFGQTKELLAGETGSEKNTMARDYAQQGLIAVAVDNPSCGELSDQGRYDYLETSRFLLEEGWSYLGLSSWQDRVVLDWMKTRPEINPERIIVSGFSLGTEPMMALGLLDPDIYAFVYNDFLCRTRERVLTMTAPEGKFPNSIEHLIPGFLLEFDFPDIVCALAPRPVICTEGGMDRDFRILESAYRAAGAPGNFEWHHYPKFADPKDRVPLEAMPAGVDRDTYFRLANVDPPAHYFKRELVLPWIQKICGNGK